MAKYPVAVRAGAYEDFVEDLLKFHFKQGKRLLDPTCGEKLMWEGIEPDYFDVVFSDIKLGQDLRELTYEEEFDGVIFDPPYFFGYAGSTDPRREAYGDYDPTYKELVELMLRGIDMAHTALKKGGKLVLKCADQLDTVHLTYYGHHYTWQMFAVAQGFRIIDTQIFQHHHISGTAWQLQFRPCAVINHSYFLVFQK